MIRVTLTKLWPPSAITGALRMRLDDLLPPAIRRGALATAVALTLLAYIAMETAGPLLSAIDHWTADLRTAFFTYQLPSQHPSVALVFINEEAIEEAQKDAPSRYRSPVDRGLLARLIARLDSIGVKAIGLDIIVDQPSEPAKDAALLAAIKAARANVVLAQLDPAADRNAATETQRAYNAHFLKQAGRASGYITVKTDMDGVVRTQPTPGTGDRSTFPEEIAKAGGWSRAGKQRLLTVTSDRIAWLQQPRDNSTTFETLPATLLIAPPDRLGELQRATVEGLVDRLVIVGVRFADNTDRHKTPLGSSGRGLMPGAEINANIVAQLVDGRGYLALNVVTQLLLCFFTALAGVIVACRWPTRSGRIGSLLIAAFAVINAVVFWQVKLILPFAAPSLVWGAAVFSGWLLVRRGTDPKLISGRT
jgi:adenylate cyclase